MDPLTLILAALAAGASTGLKDAAGEAVKDAYHGLTALIRRRFGDKPAVDVALAQHEEKPEVWGAPLKDALEESGADKDDEIVAAAERLLALLPKETAETIVNQTINNYGNVGEQVNIGGNVERLDLGGRRGSVVDDG